MSAVNDAKNPEYLKMLEKAISLRKLAPGGVRYLEAYREMDDLIRRLESLREIYWMNEVDWNYASPIDSAMDACIALFSVVVDLAVEVEELQEKVEEQKEEGRPVVAAS